jgi:putative alpha-1,2-mannosidase
VAYLYNWTDKPWKTQERVRMILKNQYHPAPDGLGGNDDCGQMSAWYIFSTLGFYPVSPGNNEYAIGSPAINNAVIQLGNGKQLEIVANNQSDKNVFVKKITLNGRILTRPFVTYEEIEKGGKMIFEMAAAH